MQSVENRSGAWKWWIAVVLFLATVLTYLDRQTLALCAPAVTKVTVALIAAAAFGMTSILADSADPRGWARAQALPGDPPSAQINYALGVTGSAGRLGSGCP